MYIDKRDFWLNIPVSDMIISDLKNHYLIDKPEHTEFIFSSHKSKTGHLTRYGARYKVNRMLILAIIKDIEIIGEAASKVTKEYREQLPRIPWLNIISMRNRLIHGYFDINLDIVWQTITRDLPPLIDELEKIFPQAYEDKL